MTIHSDHAALSEHLADAKHALAHLSNAIAQLDREHDALPADVWEHKVRLGLIMSNLRAARTSLKFRIADAQRFGESIGHEISHAEAL